ncbi:VWA domain-containing protein [Myxococcota bacterium]|nr:VWA domain-containing protein [Myxococcota bacterium]
MSPRTRRTILRVGVFIALEAALTLFFLFTRPQDGFIISLPFLGETWDFLRPGALFLLFLPPILILMPTLSDLSVIQKTLMFLFRYSLFTLIVLALARPTTRGEIRRVALVFLVDTSASVGEKQISESRKVVKKLLEQRQRSTAKVRLVTFNSRPSSVYVPGKSTVSPPLRLDEQKKIYETDIASAIRLGMSLVPPGHSSRMVLVSDGLETRGNAMSLAAELKRAKIPLYYHFPLAPAKPEVFITDFILPPKVSVKQPFELTASVVSNVDTEVELFLYQGESPEEMYKNALEFYKKVTLKPGENIVTFKAQVNDLGMQAFQLKMVPKDPAKDTLTKNNQSWAVLMAKDKPRVLYVEGNTAQGRYFASALKTADIEVVERPPWGFPASLTQMKRYSCIIQSDVSVRHVSAGKMAALTQYVRGGGCYIMVGGENSFGSGGYYQTPIEKLLPVRFDLEKNRRQPKVAMVLVIDRSGSMSGTKMRLAKEAAAMTARLMGARDMIGVVAFDHRAQTVVDLTYASNRSRVESLIRKIEASGGTDIVAGLDTANHLLCDANAKVKHIILLSDGQSGRDRLEDVLQESRQCNITISVIGIGSDVDKGMLELIKERGQGRSYYTTDPHDLPRLFTKEASKVARPPLVDQPVRAKVVKNAGFLRGIDMTKAPFLLGYVPTKAKKNAEVLLVSDLYGEPLLARWNVGAGRAIAFTSDVKPRWARFWIESWSGGFQKFWAGLLRDSMRIQKLEDYTMRVKRLDRQVSVFVDAVGDNSSWRNLFESTLTVQQFGAQGHKNISLSQTAPGRYESTFALPGHGTYLLSSKHYCSPKMAAKAGVACPGPLCPCSSKRLVGEAFASVNYSYAREVKLVQPPGKKCMESPQVCPGLMLLQNLAAQSGGGELNAKGYAKLFDRGDRVEEVFHERWKLLLWPLLLLFILDILVRRVRIFGFSATLEEE